MDPIKEFEIERQRRIMSHENNEALNKAAKNFSDQSILSQYSYNFSWLGRPIIQYPQDIIAIQEIIWEVRPDVIVETGIAHGGSLILSASILELLGSNGIVVGVDIDIRDHNKVAIQQHPLHKRIRMIQGSSIDTEIVSQVSEYVKGKNSVMVILDSNHTHNHVLRELELYSSMVTKNSYLLVFDTIVEDLPAAALFGRPWGKGNNPKTAVWEFLKMNTDFVVEKNFQNKLLITVAPGGYLKRVK